MKNNILYRSGQDKIGLGYEIKKKKVYIVCIMVYI